MKGRLSYGKIKEIHHKWKMNGNSYVNKLKKKMLPALKPEHLAFLKEISEDPRNTVLSGRERKLLLQIHFGIKIKTDAVRTSMKDLGYSMKRIRTHIPEADRISHRNSRIKVVQ